MVQEGRPAGARESDARWRIVGVVVVVALVVAALALVLLRGSVDEDLGSGPPDTPATAVPVTASGVEAAATTSPAPVTTAPACDRRAELDAGADAVPADLRARVDAALAHPAWAGLERSVSVWVEGYGEVVAADADRALLPASNEKLLTAMGAHLLLDPGDRFRTEVVRSADRLVLRAGGDPTLRSRGPHSLQALAGQVAAGGSAPVGEVVVDATAFEAATTALGWQDWQVPAYVGPMSALVVDDNRGRVDPAYLADPALGNAEAFAGQLRAVGAGAPVATGHGVASPADPVVASLDSAPVAELLPAMLLRSDNEIAEALLRRMGDGSTAVGAARVEAALDPWCLHLAGVVADGSGLSREDRRSARELRQLLQVAAEQPWGSTLRGDLPVAGVSGTLAGRLTGPATAGNVRAKTGTIIGGTALSGYATTADGRAVVFSAIVNGDPGRATGAPAAIDALVRAVVGG